MEREGLLYASTGWASCCFVMIIGLDLFGRGYILFVNGCCFDIKVYIE